MMNFRKKILVNVIIALIPVLTLNAAQASFTETVDSGTSVSGETVTPGADGPYIQNVYGSTTDTTLQGDGLGSDDFHMGWQNVNEGGHTEHTVVNNGGEQVIEGGTANNTVVNSGGTVLVSDGELTHAQVNTGGNATQTGGHTDGMDVFGRYDIYSNGTGSVADNVTIEQGGTSAVGGDATLNNWTVSGYVTDIENTLTDSPPELNHFNILNGGRVILSHGSHITDSQVNGGFLDIQGTSTADAITLNSGQVTVSDGGTLRDSQVTGGTFAVLSGGHASGITVDGGSMSNSGGTDTGTTVNAGGSYRMTGTGEASSEDLTVNTGGVATISGGTLTGDTTVGDGGVLNLLYSDALDTGTANLSLGGTVNLSASGDGQFMFNDVTMTGGAVHFAPGDGHSRLDLAALNGTGSFWMNTDLAHHQGDFLNVRGEANGDFDVYVSDTGISPDSRQPLKIIQTGGGDAGFTLANTNHVVDLGTYQYYLVSDGNGGWVLSPLQPTDPNQPVIPGQPVAPPSISPATSEILSISTIDPLLFNAELAQVQERASETRHIAHEGAVWGRMTRDRQRVHDDAGANYGFDTRTVTLGADTTHRKGNGLLTRGVFFSNGHSDVHFTGKGLGDGNVNAWSVGAYASYLHDSGYWLDSTLKADRFYHTVDGRMTSGGAATGRFNTTGIGANLRGGKDYATGSVVLTPYVSLTGFTTNSASLSLSNGMKADIAPQRSVRAKAGLRASFAVDVADTTLTPYADAGIGREFIRNNTVRVNNDSFTNDLSGSLATYQVGINAALNRDLSVHVDAGYAKGAHTESPWTGTAGVSWSFR